MSASSKQMTMQQQRAYEKYPLHCYANINTYDLVLRNVASQRPKSGDIRTDATDGFLIHTLKPSYRDPETLEITNLQACKLLNKMNLPIPKPDPEDEKDMKRYWSSSVTGVTDKGFHRQEAHKHMKFSKLKPLNKIFKQGLKHGKRYIDGDLNLMTIIRSKGYKVGNFYSCQQLLEDIEASTGKGVKLDFGTILPIKGQVLQDVRFLNEVCVLYDSDAENRVTVVREQSFLPHSFFLPEDLKYRFKRE